jgi:anti-sigma factor RsiW
MSPRTCPQCPHCSRELSRRDLAELLLELRDEPFPDGLLDRVRDHVAARPPATRPALIAALPDPPAAIDAALAALVGVAAVARWGDGYRVSKRPGLAGIARQTTRPTTDTTPRGAA